jgi:hypothetical protein
VSFRAPRQYDTNTTVIFTFEGMDDTLAPQEINDFTPISPFGPLDLSQVKYQGQNPIAWDNAAKTVSYLINVDGGREYTIDQDSFDWPIMTNYLSFWDGLDPRLLTETLHCLTWTNFHNAKPEIVGPTNLYVYCNSSPSSGVFYVTNAVPASSVSWSVTSGSDKVQINSTSGTATPTDANHASTSLNDVTITATVTVPGGQSATLTKNITVRKPWAFGAPDIKRQSENANFPVNLQVKYAVWDQLCTVFPPGLIAGVTATETFPNGSPPNSTTGAGIIQPDGTAMDTIKIPLSDNGGNINYVQVITADCATVTNNITTDPDMNWANITQTGPCH